MIRIRLAVKALAASVLAVALHAGASYAAPEVHRFNVVISAIPTSINNTGFNQVIGEYNATVLEPRNFNSLDKIRSGFMFGIEMRYLIRPNVALNFGVSHLKSQSKREFLPLITQIVDVRAEVISVPVHVGADYYFSPYTQGDFQARAYFGLGVLSSVYSNATFQQEQLTPQSGPVLPNGSFTAVGTRDAPGFYVQTGAHMFFASNISVLLGVQFRSAKVEDMIDRDTGEPVLNLKGEPVDLDLGGFGARLGMAIGF